MKEKFIQRESGIETLKLVAIFMIIISHVTQTMTSQNPYVEFNSFFGDISIANMKINNLVLVFFRYFGGIGNYIFFICSCWFWVDSNKSDKKKWFAILIEVWFVSIIILIGTLVFYKHLSTELIIKSFFPTLFANNWYITCYLLFYLIYPHLNKILQFINRNSHFRITIIMLVIYFGITFIIPGAFFASEIIYWISAYYLIAYLKKYRMHFMNQIVNSILFLFFGGGLCIVMIVSTAYLGEHIMRFRGWMLRWMGMGNPAFLLISIGALNLARRKQFVNKTVNYLSSLSLLIYIIHENIILRNLLRPYIIDAFNNKIEYENPILLVFVCAVFILVISFIASIIYDKTIRKMVRKFSTFLYECIKKVYLRFETWFLCDDKKYE